MVEDSEKDLFIEKEFSAFEQWWGNPHAEGGLYATMRMSKGDAWMVWRACAAQYTRVDKTT